MSTLLARYSCAFSSQTRFITAIIPKALFSAAILASGALLTGTLSAATTYYVSSQNGNDSWSGLLASPNANFSDGPFQSIGKAQAKMAGSSTKTVNLRAGTYSVASTLRLNSGDSGETWISYPGESPILDGGGSGQIVLSNNNNITLEGLTIQNMGPGGVVISFGNVISFRWNTFLNCKQNCINASALTNSVVDSNTFNGQSPGNPSGNAGFAYSTISLGYGSSNNQFTHNLLQNCQGTGIAFSTGPNDPPNSNNIVDRNILTNVDSNVTDGGAIYMLDNSHTAVGNQITNNVINGNGGSAYRSDIVKSFYLDGNMSNVLISGNICRSCGQWAWQIHVGDHNTIVNNIFDLSSTGTQLGLYQTNPQGADWGMSGNVFERNIVYFSGSAPSSLYQVNIVSHDALPADQSNLYFSANNSSIPNGQGIVDASPVYANPQFSQASSGNYSMPSSSPAFNMIGFQALPTDQGPRSGGPSSPGSGGGGSAGLTGSGNSSTTTANLTSEGTTDWAHWGTGSMTRKNGVTPQIGNWSIVGSGGANYYTNDPRAVTFSDGNIPSSATVHDGIFVDGQSGFSFTAPAGTSSHTLTVHVGGFQSGGKLTAHLSDGSSKDFVDSTNSVSGQYDRNYTLIYKAASAGQKITVSWVNNSGTGNVTLDGAALQ